MENPDRRYHFLNAEDMNHLSSDLNASLTAIFAIDKNDPKYNRITYTISFVSFVIFLYNNVSLHASLFYSSCICLLIWNVRVLLILYKMRKEGRMSVIRSIVRDCPNQQQTFNENGGGLSPLHLLLSLSDRDFTDDDYELLSCLDDLNVKKGASSAVINQSCHVHMYNNNVQSQCSICLEMFDKFDTVKTIKACSHSFHPECIDKWLTLKANCPICKLQLS